MKNTSCLCNSLLLVRHISFCSGCEISLCLVWWRVVVFVTCFKMCVCRIRKVVWKECRNSSRIHASQTRTIYYKRAIPTVGFFSLECLSLCVLQPLSTIYTGVSLSFFEDSCACPVLSSTLVLERGFEWGRESRVFNVHNYSTSLQLWIYHR